MKKLICFVLVLTMLAGMTVFASADGGLTFKVSSAEAAPGEEVQITVNLENNPGIAAAEFAVIYDDTVLEWTAVTQGEYSGIWDAEPGVKVTWFSNNGNWDLSGLFCTLTFKVKEDAKPGDTTINLEFEEETVFDWDEIDVPYSVVPGTITILGDEPLADGYYLIGQKGWTVDDIDPEQKFEANPNNSNEFLLETGLAERDGIKVVKVESGAIVDWYPGGVDNQYVVDAAHAGRKTIYFHPWYDEAWSQFGGFIWIDGALTPAAEIYGSSVSLKGNIAMNFYVILPDELKEDTAAYVMLNDTKYPIAEATTRAQGDLTLYQFTMTLHAKQMNDKIVLRVFNGEDQECPLFRWSNGEDLSETGFVYSVQDYIAKARETSTDEKLLALLNAMSDYGSLAQAQFNYNVDDRVPVEANLDAVTADDLAPFAAKVTEGAAEGLSYLGTSLLLQSETIMRVYFTPDEGAALEDFTFKVGTKKVTAVDADGRWFVEIPNISAKDLDKVYTVKVTCSAGTVVTVKTCALSYAYSVLNAEETPAATLVDLVKGIYLYNKAANDYFG